jgi:hypothetical protein
MDPLSGVASVIAVIQLAGMVVDVCYQYRGGLRHPPKAVKQLISEVEGIREVLKQLDSMFDDDLSSASLHLTITKELMKTDGLLDQCFCSLDDLKKALEPKQGWREIRQALVWPLTEKDVDKALQRLQRLKRLLALSLTGDHT